MCNRVGVKFDEIDFKDSELYVKHEWTENEQDKFRESHQPLTEVRGLPFGEVARKG